jgi:hypothetical protein
MLELMKFAAAVLAIIPLALTVSPIHASFLVLPNAQTSTVANDSSGSLAGPLASIEAQDIWDKSQFPSGDLLITQFAFRLKPDTGPLIATDTSFALYMSTTPVSPSTISATFAANRGSDYTLVASAGPGTLWSSPGCAGPGPCPFDIVFTLSTPFLYSKSRGFFLTDLFVTSYNGVGTGQFDVENYLVNPLVGEVFSSTGSPTGQVEFSDNVTRIGFTSVPEPATWTLMLCSLGVLAALRRGRSS